MSSSSRKRHNNAAAAVSGSIADSASSSSSGSGSGAEDAGKENGGEAALIKKAPKKSATPTNEKKDGCSTGTPPPVYLKLLIPSVASGAIIGKGGETIADLQKQTQTRIKMSKSADFYPGTNERVCLVSGTIENILVVLDFIAEKIKEKPDPNAKPAIDFDNKVPAEREKQVKVLIPNTTAGMIIGKGGSFIKAIKDESGAFIQLSQKSKETALAERVVTVIGESENNRQAMKMILEKIEEDPQSASCLHISYSDVHGLVANFNPTGSPFALSNGHPEGVSAPPTTSPSSQQPSQTQQSAAAANCLPANNSSSTSTTPISVMMDTSNNLTAKANVVNAMENNPFILPLTSGGALHLKFNMNPTRPPTDPALMGQYLHHISVSLKASGYSEIAAEEIAQAIHCLASHGIVVMHLTSGSPNATSSPPSSQSPFTLPLPSTPRHLGPPQPMGPPPHHHHTFVAAQPHPHGVQQRGVMSFHQENHAGQPPPPPPQQPTTSFATVSTTLVNAPQVAPATYSRYWNNGGGGEQGHPPPHHPAPHPRDLQEGYVRGSNSPSALMTQQQQQFLNNNSFGLGPNTGLVPPPPPPLPPGAEEQQIDRVEIEINENIIGAVIGPSGRSIVDIQQFSGARIQISKKGTFSPGTRNRIVTIAGLPESIAQAKYMIEQKIIDEENKRERNSY